MTFVTSTNVDIARRGFAAFSHGDFEGVLSVRDPEVEWHLAFRLPDLPPEKTLFRGHTEVRTLLGAFAAVWEQLTAEIEEVLHDEDEVLITRVRFRGRGHTSGVEVDRVFFYVQDIRNGKLVRHRPFDDAADAFAAAGVKRD